MRIWSSLWNSEKTLPTQNEALLYKHLNIGKNTTALASVVFFSYRGIKKLRVKNLGVKVCRSLFS